MCNSDNIRQAIRKVKLTIQGSTYTRARRLIQQYDIKHLKDRDKYLAERRFHTNEETQHTEKRKTTQLTSAFRKQSDFRTLTYGLLEHPNRNKLIRLYSSIMQLPDEQLEEVVSFVKDINET